MKNQKKGDRRVQQTRTRLKETMLAMLDAQPLHKITVRDLCRECQLNRSTFYAHYQDIFDLAEAMEEDILTDLNGLMEQLDGRPFSSEQVCQAFFSFLQTHKTALHIFLCGENSTRFTKKIDAKIMPYFEQQVLQKYTVPPGAASNTIPLLLRFIATGYYSFFTQALQTEEPNNTQLAQFASRLGDACLSEFLWAKE